MLGRCVWGGVVDDRIAVRIMRETRRVAIAGSRFAAHLRTPARLRAESRFIALCLTIRQPPHSLAGQGRIELPSSDPRSDPCDLVFGGEY